MREVQGYPLPLGVQISENKINFSIAVPTEKKCQLLIYRAGRKRLYRQFEMETAVGEVRCIALTDIDPEEYAGAGRKRALGCKKRDRQT